MFNHQNESKMNAITVIEKMLENDVDNSSCGVHTFDCDVKTDAIRCFGDFNAAILPKPGLTYFYQWIEVTSTPFIQEPDAFLLQGEEDVPMILYFWQLD